MANEKRNVELSDIGNGEMMELANDELRKIFADLRDPNKIASSGRELVIKIKASAPEKRKSAEITYMVSTKLGAREGGKQQIYISGNGDDVESGIVPMNQPSFEFNSNKAS